MEVNSAPFTPSLCQCSVLRVFKAKATQIRGKSEQTVLHVCVDAKTSIRACEYGNFGSWPIPDNSIRFSHLLFLLVPILHAQARLLNSVPFTPSLCQYSQYLKLIKATQIRGKSEQTLEVLRIELGTSNTESSALTNCATRLLQLTSKDVLFIRLQLLKVSWV